MAYAWNHTWKAEAEGPQAQAHQKLRPFSEQCFEIKSYIIFLKATILT